MAYRPNPPVRGWLASALLVTCVSWTSAGQAEAPPQPPPQVPSEPAPSPVVPTPEIPDESAPQVGVDGQAAEEADSPESPAADASEAAPEPAAPSGDPDALTPPKLLAFVPAVYPPEAHAQKLQGSVVLVVEIGEDGFVRDAEVKEPAGHGFDEAARAAVLRFAFEPAQRGTTPIAARILYRYDFVWQPVAETAAAAVELGELEVEVWAAAEDAPLKDVDVVVAIPGDTSQVLRATTDASGKVKFDQIVPGEYQVTVAAEYYATQLQTETVVAGQVTTSRYRLEQDVGTEEGYGAQAVVEAPAREVTRRTIEREVLTRVAGTRGDALRTIELLPGVARPPFSAGLVIIRGASPQDSTVQLDGAEVPLLYHFGGLTSFFQSWALERIDFYPGNFSARYGRAMGGVVDVEVRDPSTTGYHGMLDVNLPLDSSLLIEGPITQKASFLVAGRRSYFGEVVRLTIPDGTFDTFAAPVYYDAQAIVTYRPTAKDRIRFVGYVSGDSLDILFAEVPADDPQLRGIDVNLNFQRMQAEWRHRYNDDLTHDIRLAYGRNPNQFDLGPEYYFDLLAQFMTMRAEWRYQISPKVTVTAGTDSIFGRYKINYRGPAPTQSEGNPGDMDALSALPVLQLDDYSAPTVLPAIYFESDLRPWKDWQFVLGLRIDYQNYIQEPWFDPRLTMIYQVTEKAKLKAGVGVYSQGPEVQESAAVVGGNPNLVPMRAMHYGVGTEYEFNEVFSVGVDGFFKNIYDNVVGAPNGSAGPSFINDGTGRIYGMELSGRAKGGEKFFGFFSYTLMKSERNDRGQGYRPFDYDQRHILSVAGNYNFGNGWELGGTFRVVTGNPITPVVSANYNADANVYQPSYGPTNSERAPTFHRLDVRAQRKWTFDQWSLAVYLDIQNVYNAKNPEGNVYSFDYSEVEPVRGLPIVPVLGLRGQL